LPKFIQSFSIPPPLIAGPLKVFIPLDFYELENEISFYPPLPVSFNFLFSASSSAMRFLSIAGSFMFISLYKKDAEDCMLELSRDYEVFIAVG
jgi:hypothetical protein